MLLENYLGPFNCMCSRLDLLSITWLLSAIVVGGQQPTLPSSWPQFRHGFDSNGLSSLVGPSGLARGSVGVNFTINHRKFDAGAEVQSSASVDVDGTVYVLTDHSTLIGVQAHSIVVTVELSKERLATCHQEIPQNQTHYGTEITASPLVVAPGFVMVSSAHDLRMYLIDCRDKAKPRVVWQNADTAGVCTSAVHGFNNTVIYTSQSLSRVYAYDVTTLPFDTKQNATWSASLQSDSHNIQASVSVASDDGSIYVPVYHTPKSHLLLVRRNGSRPNIAWDLQGIPLTSPAVWVGGTGCHLTALTFFRIFSV